MVELGVPRPDGASGGRDREPTKVGQAGDQAPRAHRGFVDMTILVIEDMGRRDCCRECVSGVVRSGPRREVVVREGSLQ